MSNIEIVKEWMKFSNIPDSFFDKDIEGCGFRFADQFDIMVQAPDASEDIFVSIDLLDGSDGKLLNDRLAICMQLNAYGLDTRGAILGYDPTSKKIMLSYRIGSKLVTAQSLANIINNLVDTAQEILPQIKLEQREAAQTRDTAIYSSLLAKI
jgi:hypothetical protein